VAGRRRICRATTGADGIATVGSWTLGTTAGSNTLTATSDTLTGSPVTFTATGTAGPASKISVTLSPTSVALGGTSTATATVTDADDNPVSGVNVTFSSAAGASVPGAAVATDVSGVATATVTASATQAGTVVITGSFGPGGSEAATATLTVNPGVASKLTVATGTASRPRCGWDATRHVIVTGCERQPGRRVDDGDVRGRDGWRVGDGDRDGRGADVGVATVTSWTIGSGGDYTLTATSDL
jgi:hypothetical protein